MACGKAKRSIDNLLYISASFDLSNIFAVLSDDLLLIWNILQPVNVLCTGSGIFSL